MTPLGQVVSDKDCTFRWTVYGGVPVPFTHTGMYGAWRHNSVWLILTVGRSPHDDRNAGSGAVAETRGHTPVLFITKNAGDVGAILSWGFVV
jgi:hypothetical protein